jgi:hypothetical protein
MKFLFVGVCICIQIQQSISQAFGPNTVTGWNVDGLSYFTAVGSFSAFAYSSASYPPFFLSIQTLLGNIGSSY